MSWLPIFEIGLWNAWILMLYFPLHPLIMIVVDKAVGTGEIFKKMGDVPYKKGEKRVFVISLVVILFLLAYSVFLPLKLGTVWFYAGFTTYLVGLVMLLTSIVNISTTPLGQPFTKGMYRYSRHPMMFSESITFVGVSVASASWIFLLLSVVIIILQTSQAVAEERGCLETYGDKYKEYMNRTPRWIGIPKSR
ncbi:MAG: isoprenylcysteine carboxylmethyltransferase family protein [Anaerolineaceae bacterium]|nr:isoprenylcysteine carboxylmethyltransferase family protein [Anaerolineaceae bacterium]